MEHGRHAFQDSVVGNDRGTWLLWDWPYDLQWTRFTARTPTLIQTQHDGSGVYSVHFVRFEPSLRPSYITHTHKKSLECVCLGCVSPLPRCTRGNHAVSWLLVWRGGCKTLFDWLNSWAHIRRYLLVTWVLSYITWKENLLKKSPIDEKQEGTNGTVLQVSSTSMSFHCLAFQY